MGKFIDLKDKRFGKLLVLSLRDKNINGAITWLCLCDCGNQKIICGTSLRIGKTKSCGCVGLQKLEIGRMNSVTHGHRRNGHTSKIYYIWAGIIQRCTNQNYKYYKDYGGRGIRVCERWLKFENFYKDVGDPPEKLTIDRINNDGDYEPSNWRWATQKDQCRNQRTNLIITYNNQGKCLSEWAEIYGIKYGTLWNRVVKLKWDFEKAIRRIK
jgi:hypothetical protein